MSPRDLVYLGHMLDMAKKAISAKERRLVRERLQAIPPHEERLVLATGRYIGEGFDDARLDTLFLALPVSWKGTLVQYSGRLHRLNPGKTDVRVVDYVDNGADVAEDVPKTPARIPGDGLRPQQEMGRPANRRGVAGR
jgi:superfamily II DNA or RNA helicase